MTESAEMDRHTILAVKRAIKKARKVGRPIVLDGERILYCIRCLKGNHEVERMVYDSYCNLCSECIDNLAIFLGHLRNAEKQRYTQAQSEPDESQSAPDRHEAQDEGC